MKIKSSNMPHPVDVYVGVRLRQIRTKLRVSQEEIGEAVGITFQQVQKYEKGTNRISCSRLFDLSKFLKVPINYFFKNIASDYSINDNESFGFASDGNSYYGEEEENRDINILIENFKNIDDPAIRLNIINIVKNLSNSNDR